MTNLLCYGDVVSDSAVIICLRGKQQSAPLVHQTIHRLIERCAHVSYVQLRCQLFSLSVSVKPDSTTSEASLLFVVVHRLKHRVYVHLEPTYLFLYVHVSPWILSSRVPHPSVLHWTTVCPRVVL